MAQTGLRIFLLISILLLDQTISQASKFKARKHSKRRVKEKDDLKTQIDKLWREVNALKEMQALQTVCLRGTKAHKKCYLVSEGTKYFHEANEDCIAKGGTLAIPRNNDETNALRDYGKKSMPRVSEFWLGVNDLINEGKFVDVNGMALQYFNWDRAQPNGGKRENCVFFSQSSQDESNLGSHLHHVMPSQDVQQPSLLQDRKGALNSDSSIARRHEDGSPF